MTAGQACSRLIGVFALSLAMASGAGCSTVAASSDTGDETVVNGGGVRDLAASARPLERLAFGSCARQDKEQPIWDAILAAQPDLFVFTGDNVYGDWRHGLPNRNNEDMSSLRAAYDDASRIDGWRRLRATVPFEATWDDHDYGLNDAGAEFPYKETAQQMFADFWQLPADDPRRSREGIYHDIRFGPEGQRVTVVLLDTRYFRSPLKLAAQGDDSLRGPYRPDDSPDKTMLGSAQWTWLGGVMNQPTDVLVLISSTQVLADGHGFERWGNLPREWQRLMDMITQSPARAVIIVSGDRHHGSLYRMMLPGGREVTEITSSGLTEVARRAREPGARRIGDLLRERNFGMLGFDWPNQRVTASLHDEQGVPVRSLDVMLPR